MVFAFMLVIVIGAFIIPTLLIGMVSIAFEEASHRTKIILDDTEKLEIVLPRVKALLPDFFRSPDRIERIKDVFDTMDAEGGGTLDVLEMSFFFAYTFYKIFGVMLNSSDREKLFHIMDSDGDTELCFAEFVSSIAAIKKTETRCFEDPGFSERAFPVGTRVRWTEISKNDSSVWKEAMEALDAAALKETWKQILNLLDTTFARETSDESARAFLQSVDVDQSGEVDSEELSEGFQALGLSLDDRQLRVFRGDISGGDSNKALTLEEFISRVRVERKKIEANKNEAIKRQAADLLKRSNSILSCLGDEVCDFAISGCDSRRTLEEVVCM